MTDPMAPEGTASLRGLMESRAVGFAEWNADGCIVAANETFATLLGCARSELLASRMSWRSLLPSELHTAEEAALEAAAKQGVVWDHRTQLVRVDGSRIPVVLALFRTGADRRSHAMLALDDGRRRSPERIRMRQWNMYRQFLDAAPDLVVLRDASAQIIWANRAFLDFHRTTLEAILGRIAPPGRSEEATRRELEALATLQETGVPAELPPEALLREDGAVRYFYTTCQRFGETSPAGTTTISVSRDSTDRATAEQALARSEANLRTAQAIAQIGSWELHIPYRGDDYWSEEMFHILGFDPARGPLSPERYVDEIVHPDDRPAARDALASIGSRETRFEQTYRIVRPDGCVRWLSIQANLVRNAEGAVETIIGTMRDVSDQKQAAAQREQLENRLRQAQKLEAVGTLAGGIAHDFNNILGAMAGYAELAFDASRENPEVQADLQQVLRAAERAADLVSRILTFSRQQAVPRQPLHLEVPIHDALQLLRAALPATITIRESIDPATPLVSGDETQILQVMMNLGTNALHGMHERGGVLEVRLEPFVVNPELARANGSLAPGLHARLSVSDTGVGIEAHLLDRVLEPFFTTKPPGLGTGLGLSVVHGIVLEHGGALEVESLPDRGTTVRVYLPALAESARARVNEGPRAPAGRGQRVLLVDDETALAELGRRRLEGLGYEPVAYTDARQALTAFQRAPGDFALLLTDHTMPHLSGLELARKIREIRPELPVILVSGHGDCAPPEELAGAGVRENLHKPVARHTLAQAIFDALDETCGG